MGGKLRIGYWKIRGLAEPIRALLKYAEADYEEDVYECGDGPGFDRSCWTEVKFTLGLEFPNLPYLFDGDVKLTQTIPILHYLSTKFNLVPKEFPVHAKCDMVDHVAYDLIMMGVRVMYASKDAFEAGKENLVKGFKASLQQISAFLGTKSYVAGDYITGSDFLLYEAIDRCVKLDSKVIQHENIRQWRQRIQDQPTLQKYFSDPESSITWPLNNKMAAFK